VVGRILSGAGEGQTVRAQLVPRHLEHLRRRPLAPRVALRPAHEAYATARLLRIERSRPGKRGAAPAHLRVRRVEVGLRVDEVGRPVAGRYRIDVPRFAVGQHHGVEAGRGHVAAQQGGRLVDALAEVGADGRELGLEFRGHDRAFDEAEGRPRAVRPGQGEDGRRGLRPDVRLVGGCCEVELKCRRVDGDGAEGGRADGTAHGLRAAGAEVVPGLGRGGGAQRGHQEDSMEKSHVPKVRNHGQATAHKLSSASTSPASTVPLPSRSRRGGAAEPSAGAAAP